MFLPLVYLFVVSTFYVRQKKEGSLPLLVSPYKKLSPIEMRV